MLPLLVRVSFPLSWLVSDVTMSCRVLNLGALYPGHHLWNNVVIQSVACLHCLKKTLYNFAYEYKLFCLQLEC